MKTWITLIVAALLAAPCAAQQQGKKGTPKKDIPRPDLRGMKIERNIVYAEVDGHKLVLDLYLPEKMPATPLPLVVWVHGGGWSAGGKNSCMVRYLPLQGYAMASIDYRLSGDAPFPAQIHDCKAAIRFLRANAAKYGFNATRVGVGGSSAGGHLVALMGTTNGVKEMEGTVGVNLDQSSSVQAVLDLYGPADFSMYITGTGANARVPNQSISKLLGGKAEMAEPVSPVHWVSKGDAPLLIFQGDSDTTVDPQHSKTLHAQYQKAGLDSTLVMILGAGHGGPEYTDEVRQKLVVAFFDKHLKGKTK